MFKRASRIALKNGRTLSQQLAWLIRREPEPPAGETKKPGPTRPSPGAPAGRKKPAAVASGARKRPRA